MLAVNATRCYWCGAKTVQRGGYLSPCYVCEYMSFERVFDTRLTQYYNARENLGKSCLASTIVRSTEVEKAKRARASQRRYENLCVAREKRWPW